MNIFFLSMEPKECAQYHVDKHVVKMIVEYCQLLSTAHHQLNPKGIPTGIYGQTHQNHPSAIWAREGASNYKWLHRLLVALCGEYTYRYDRIHKSQSSGVVELLRKPPPQIPSGATKPRLAMPDDVKHDDTVTAYRNLYATHKDHLLVWTGRDMPEWLESFGYKSKAM